MIQIDLIPKNVYSCQFCGKWFENEEVTIIQNFYPVCSFKCKFNLIYQTLKDNYSDENLEIMFDLLKKGQVRGTFSRFESLRKSTFNKNIALFELSKYFSKFDLHSVISVFSFLILKKAFSRESPFLIPPTIKVGVEKANLENMRKDSLTKKGDNQKCLKI